jgi:hypothetical protein
MSKPKEAISPFLEVEDALAVAGIINRFAASFDVKEELSLPEARVLFVLLVRTMTALLHAYPDELEELTMRAMLAREDELEPDDAN